MVTGWADRILDSADIVSPDLPGFPPDAVQQRFVGKSGRAALAEVKPFYETITRHHAITPYSRILDFGCGWGRIARFFQGAGRTLYLADVDQEALDWCSSTNVGGEPVKLDPHGLLPLADQSTHVAYSYSVFSHLSEDAARHWLREISRVLAPGGLFVFTVLSARFLHLVRACHDKSDANDIERRIGLYMGHDPSEAIQKYERGEFAYSDNLGQGGAGVLTGDFYGWAAAPLAWVHKAAPTLEILEFKNDQQGFDQAVIIARKR